MNVIGKEVALSGLIPTAEIEAFKASGAFDSEWYLAQYPDVAMAGLDAAEHYLWIGKRLGRSPNAGGAVTVSQSDTLSKVAAAANTLPSPLNGSPHAAEESSVAIRVEPSVGQDVVSASNLGDGHQAGQQGARDPSIDPHVYETVSAAFDHEYYLLTYPDVAAAGVDPVSHYLLAGWTEGRNPTISFSTTFYLDQHTDVAQAGVNPFYHYVIAGKNEGRVARHELGFRYDILAGLKSVREQIAEARRWRSAINPDPIGTLDARLRSLVEAGRKLILSFSHDDFTSHVGGVQLLLRRELNLLKRGGFSHLHVFPAHPLLFIDTSGDDVLLGVIVDGVKVGYFPASQIIASARAAGLARIGTSFIVHHLFGQNVKQTIDLIGACGAQKGYYWVHDYAALYNNFMLLRNNVEYCGVPRPGQVAWQLCEYARADFSQSDEIAKLFVRFPVEVIAPSEAAARIWREADQHREEGIRVLEHCRIVPDKPMEKPQSGPLKVAFLGYPSAHKGWFVFRDLVMRFGGDPRYEFYHLGKGRQGGLKLTYREVMACEDKPDAMRLAVEDLGLDVALMWSIWPETFCLAAYEGLAGGAALITNEDAGNVPDLVRRCGNGLVLSDEAALHEAFDSGEIIEQSRRRRPDRLGLLDYSSLTAGLIEKA